MRGHNTRRAPDEAQKRRKIPRQSRTIPIEGFGEDDGKFFTCWYCGFTCNKDRDSLGDSESGSGENHESFVVPYDTGILAEYGVAGDGTTPLARLALLGGEITHFQLAMENGQYGTPKSVGEPLHHTNGIGCPQCNSLNWRGDYP